MFRVTFSVPYQDTISAYSAQGLCLPLPGGIVPRAGDTWIVETARRASSGLLYVRLVRRWRGSPSDYETVEKGQPDFRRGVLVFRDGTAFPMDETSYVQAWKDYQTLSQDTNAVIIRDGKAIRWRKKGKQPVVLSLSRFATKYKRQPLLGRHEEVKEFIDSLDGLVAKAIERSNRRRGMTLRKELLVKQGGITTPAM